MPRKLRVEYEGAIYHVMNRGDRREPIFHDDHDRELFLKTLGEACGKTGWQVHAYCLMLNHFHLVVETPQANLSAGMRWFLGTYTARFNRRHKYFAQKQGRAYYGEELREAAEQKAERIVSTMLGELRLSETQLKLLGKGDQRKGRIAARLRAETTMTWPWIAHRLAMGHWRTAVNATQALKQRN